MNVVDIFDVYKSFPIAYPILADYGKLKVRGCEAADIKAKHRVKSISDSVFQTALSTQSQKKHLLRGDQKRTAD